MIASPQLDPQEVAVLKAFYDHSLKAETDFIDIRDIVSELQKDGLSSQDIQESLDTLLGQHLFDEYAGKRGSGSINMVKTNVYGFVKYANQFLPDIDQIYNSTLDAIVNEGLKEHKEIATHLKKPKMLVAYIFDLLKHNRLIKAAQFMGSDADYVVTEVTPEAKKLARKLRTEKRPDASKEKAVDQTTISRKEDKRNRVLLRTYFESDGDVFHAVPDDLIIGKEGVTAEELVNEIQPYLVNEGYIKYMTFRHTAIDHRGIKRVEEQLIKKDEAREPVAVSTSSNATVEILETKYKFTDSQNDENFFLELDRFMTFIRNSATVKPFSERLIAELQQQYEEYRSGIEAEQRKAIEIRDIMIERYPEMDDRGMERPTDPMESWEYENSFEEFENIIKGARSRFGYPLFTGGKYEDDSDVSKLISILRSKVGFESGSNEPKKIDSDIEYQLQDLETSHTHPQMLD